MSEYTYASTTLANGYRVEVVKDEDPCNPREWDNAGTVAALVDGCRYAFGDERRTHDEIHAITNDPSMIVLPVYMYDHSGTTINTTGFSCPWDSGQIGIIYISRRDAVKEWGKKLCTQTVAEQARKCLKAEIETLDQYITGCVYGYCAYNPDGQQTDSCWGFYGSIEECLAEGVSAVKDRIYEGETA
jgi:hypothetical protein